MSAREIRKVLVTSRVGNKEITERAVSEGFGHVELVFAHNSDEALEQIVDADVVLVGPWDARMLRAAQRLRWVHADHGGVEGNLFSEFVESRVLFSSLKPIFGIAGAETALGAMLMFSRRLNYILKPPPGPDWMDSRDHVLLPQDLSGRTVGIVGMGHMGRALAQRASCLGLRVLAIARNDRPAPDGVDRMFARSRLDDLLGEADYVVVSVPNTEETRGTVGESFLRAMKETAFLIDLSGRPPIYDYAAIVRAIQERWIAGVCMQPSGYSPDQGMPPADSEFWRRDNVVVTPCRVTSVEMHELSLDLFFGNLRRLQAGERLEGLVDKRAGY